MKSPKPVKPYLPDFTKFIVKKLSLKKNVYTSNDYLYIRKYIDFTVSYNPRCQLLDISPNRNNYASNPWTKYHCNKMKEITQKFWNDLSYNYFLNYGIVLDNYIHCRLYGVTSQSPGVDYITKLSAGDIDEWSEVENWEEVARVFQKMECFKYACWGSIDKFQSNGKMTKQEEKELSKKKSRKPSRYFSSETYAEKWYFEDAA